MSTKKSNKSGTQLANRAEATPPTLGKVLYRYKPRRTPGVNNSNHMLYDGKLDSSVDKFTVRRNAAGAYVLGISEKDKKWLIEKLGLSEEDLNLTSRSNEYLSSITVEMPKGGLSLDLDDPWEFLVDKILMSYDNVFAPSTKTQNNKRSYRYIRMQEQEEGSVYLEDQDIKKAAYKRLGDLEKSRERMIMLVLLDKVRLNPGVRTEDLRVMVNKMADTSPRKFVNYIDDPLFLEKGILNMGVLTKEIELRSGLYYFEETPLASKGLAATFTNAAHFMADNTNGDIKLALSNKVLDEFNRVK